MSTGESHIPVLSSPRQRRRLLYAGVALAVVAAFAAAAVVLPSGHRHESALRPGPDTAPAPKPLHLTAADRRSIDGLLARYVPAALGRRDLDTAYELSTPALRQGMSLAEWRRGSIPVFPYRAMFSGRHSWKPAFAFDNEVNFDLLLQPARDEKLGPISFTFDLRHIGGRWLVDSVFPAAVFTKPGHGARITAQADFGAADATGAGSESRLDATWLIVPGILLALVVLVPIGFGIVHWRRSVLAYRRGIRDLSR